MFRRGAMDDDADGAVEPVPGLDVGPGSQPGPLLYVLNVDGEAFAVRRGRGGGTDYDWISGPNEGYGFGSSAGPEAPEDEHRQIIRSFLSMIDPATGYIAED
jgi:hypothetical protein